MRGLDCGTLVLATDQNGGYRTSSLEQRQLQNVTAEWWPSRRIE
jgi:hypothetical protein